MIISTLGTTRISTIKDYEDIDPNMSVEMRKLCVKSCANADLCSVFQAYTEEFGLEDTLEIWTGVAEFMTKELTNK